MTHHQRTRKHLWDTDRKRISSPDQEGHILKNESKPHGDEDLPEIISRKLSEEDSHHYDSHEGDDNSSTQDGEEIAALHPHQSESQIARQKVIGAMGKVNDPHHSKNKGEAAGKEKKESTVRDTVKGLRDPKIHCHLTI